LASIKRKRDTTLTTGGVGSCIKKIKKKFRK
jgi:hypothetical protein